MSLDLAECTVLGGFGYSLQTGQRLCLRFRADALLLEGYNVNTTERVFYPEVVELAIDGPGTVTTGGGITGGGFGVTGALEGMAIASIVNALTTRTNIHTFVHLVTHQGELFLHYGGLEPGALRIALSPVFARLRRFDPTWLDARLQRLEALRGQQVLTEEQLERLRTRLLSRARLSGLEERDALDSATCSSCGTSIFASADVCDVCGQPLVKKAAHGPTGE